DEAIVRHVERIKIDFEPRTLNFVELRVDANPAGCGGIPVFADPMVVEVTGFEIRTETAARPGRHTLAAQHGDQQHREMTADPDEACLDRPSDRKRPAVTGKKAIQHPLYRSDMDFTSPLIRKRNPVEGRRMLMQ